MENRYHELQTPCYVLLSEELENCIDGFYKALNNKFAKAVVGYSVKTNSLPYCLTIAKKHGCYAEVVSYHEYALALKAGFTPSHIIYNGPLKSEESFLEAIKSGAMVNIETWRELEWLRKLPQNNCYKVGIRLNVDISAVSPMDENHENDDSRFGFSVESGDFERALNLLKKMPHITLAGLHTHRTSKTRSLDFYRNVIKYAQETIKQFGLSLDYLDIGGGYFGPMPNKPTFEDYANIFEQTLSSQLKNLTIIVEPGNALVASAFDYISQVIDVKYHNHQYYVTTDGTRNDIDPFFHKLDYFKTIHHISPTVVAHEPQVVTGSTCLEYDRLFSLEKENELLHNGDRIVYHRVGAYTLALTPLFIHYFPRIYLLNAEGSFEQIREEWTANEFVQKSKY